MSDTSGFLTQPDGEKVAWRKVEGRGPTVVWLSGFRSDMLGGKAQALADWALERGQACLRFDYFGHGESSGDFVQGNITRWREDALAAIDQLTEGPLVLVGSSMGGWISCLCALARPERVAGMVLVAPAPDFTEKLMGPGLSDSARAALAADGVWMAPSIYGDPTPIARQMIEDGDRWSILPGPVPIAAPVRIVQGAEDPDVPWAHALMLAQALKGDDVVFTLVKDGDHRLSRPQDIARIISAVAELTV